MGVPLDELFAYLIAYIVKGKAALLPFDLAVKRNLEQYISKLLPHQGNIVCIDGFHRFIGFLNELHADGLMGLLPVPGTAALAPQKPQDLHQIFDPVTILPGKRNHVSAPLYPKSRDTHGIYYPKSVKIASPSAKFSKLCRQALHLTRILGRTPRILQKSALVYKAHLMVRLGNDPL